jgi:20S proteasome alpha/beta subunit
MTIVICIKCTDGAVIAADSMLTLGEMQQAGQKIHLLNNSKIFAFAGDLSLAERFRAFAANQSTGTYHHKLQYATDIAKLLAESFTNTGINPQTANLCTVLVHEYSGSLEVCEFICGVNPRYLDSDHFTSVIGTGKAAALPFLNFLLETFTCNRQPNIADAKLFATWAVDYAIARLAGSVGGDIDLATVERSENGSWDFRELQKTEKDEIMGAINCAKGALIEWKRSFLDEANAEAIPRATS